MTAATTIAAETDWDLVCLIGMWLDFDEDLSDFEKDLIEEVLGRFDANGPDRTAFRLTGPERTALEAAWEAIQKAAERAPEAA